MDWEKFSPNSALPDFPFLVVISTTPLPEREP